MEWIESDKLPGGGAILGGSPHFCGFYLLEPHQVLLKESQKSFLTALAGEKGRENFGKYIQSILHYKGLFSREKTLLEYSPMWGKGVSLTLVPSSLPVSPKGGKRS